ncbi:hypothetical protein [Rhizobium phaseoli]|uniref:hypothetical protein n=1 Tax=Rhizobium phaseoli TaxID=396 RepID=UPI002556EA52|nr:hypothetical protein [Rhizobium phaseoli]MDK4729367.1 hypothetical protein [Rhizobium phaseoli]
MIPLEPKRLDDEITTQMSLRTLFALAIMSGLIGLGTAAWMDHHYKTRDRVDQEISWRLKP